MPATCDRPMPPSGRPASVSRSDAFGLRVRRSKAPCLPWVPCIRTLRALCILRCVGEGASARASVCVFTAVVTSDGGIDVEHWSLSHRKIIGSTERDRDLVSHPLSKFFSSPGKLFSQLSLHCGSTDPLAPTHPQLPKKHTPHTSHIFQDPLRVPRLTARTCLQICQDNS